MKKFPRFCAVAVAAPLLALGLSGCSMFGHKDDTVACPETGIMKEASRLPVFNDADTKQAQAQPVAVDAHIVNFGGGCVEKKAGQLDMELSVSFTGQNFRTQTPTPSQDLPYFIAVLSPDQQILQREAFTTTLNFDNSEAKAGQKPGFALSTEQHTIHLPLTEGKDPADYKVVIGFALTPAQLKYDTQH